MGGTNVSTLVAFSNSMNEETTAGAVYAMPATTPQARLLNLEQTAGLDAAWNVAVRFRLFGPLDRERFERSLQLLTTRHEVLRTALSLHQDAVIQAIVARVTLPVEWCDLRALPAEAQAVEVMHLSLEHARQPLSVKNAPLLRVRVLRLSDDEHLMLWSAHHAICDGWSVGLLTRDLMDYYGELLSGREPASKNSLDYGDYAVWLDTQRRTPEYEAHRSYWKRRLRGTKVPALPISWRNQEPALAASAIHSTLLPRKLTDRLGAIAQRHGATFFHAALAAFAVLMRLQQESALVAVGTPLSGRDQPELEDIVGTFINYVPLQFRVESEKQYVQLLHSVRDLVADSLEHSQFKFEDMLADLEEAGVPAIEDKLFSAVFICQQDFVRPITSAGVALTAVPSVSPGALRPLTVFMVERPDGWRLSCEVDNRVVSAAAGSALLEDFQRLMAAIAAHSEESITLLAARAAFTHFSSLSNAANGQLGPESRAAREMDKERGPVRIHATEFQRRFWQLDTLNPGGAAFHIRIRLELNGKLNVDAFLSALGKLTQRHEILRTTLEEKDGEIWQVIHPELPIDFRFLVSDSQVPDALRAPAQRTADQAILDREGRTEFSLTAGPLFRVRILKLESERHWLAITLSHGIVDGWSTGLFLEQLQQAYEQCVAGTHDEIDETSILQFSDYTETEQTLLASPERNRRTAWWREYLQGVWAPLSLPRDIEGTDVSEGDVRAGLEVTSLAPDVALSVRRFARECQTTQFAVFGALFQALLLRYSGQKDVLFLTPHANRAGNAETIMGPLADPICLTGHIGPETTFRELVTRFGQQSMDAMENALPLNLVTSMVDMRMAGGYHPLSQIIFFYQRAFVHDMEWKGLRVQSLPDAPSVTGSEWQLGIVERAGVVFLEFLYDATLYSRETIQTVGHHFGCLLTRAIAEPEKALSKIQILTAQELAGAAGDEFTLPVIQRLLPRENVTVPITVAAGAAAQIEEKVAAVASPPVSQAEFDILRIWRKLFKIEDLDAESNFFDLGGHSLLLARLQIAIKKEFNVQLTAADVFRQPTIATLAAWLERKQLAARSAVGTQASSHDIQNPRIVPIQPLGAGRPIFVISQSMIFRTLAAELGTDQPVFAVQMLDEDAEKMESASYEELIDFYVRLIREVQPDGPYRLAGWCVSGWIAYGVARRLEEQRGEIEMLMVIDSWAPAYWSSQPRMLRRLMLAIYKVQRSRWVGRQLSRTSTPLSGTYIRRKLDGVITAANQVFTRFRQRKLPAEPREAEELRRTEQLQRTANRAALAGPLRGGVLLFRSEEEPTGPLLAPDMGWAQVVGRDVQVEVLPGDHHQIFDLPGARIMAVRGREILTAASSSYRVSDASGKGAQQQATVHSIPWAEA